MSKYFERRILLFKAERQHQFHLRVSKELLRIQLKFERVGLSSLRVGLQRDDMLGVLVGRNVSMRGYMSEIFEVMVGSSQLRLIVGTNLTQE